MNPLYFTGGARMVTGMATASFPPPAAPAELWACDGCPTTGTEAQVLAHLDAVLCDTDGRLIDPPEAPCRGAYLVGGPAWEAHVFHGVHPMQILDADLTALAHRYGAL